VRENSQATQKDGSLDGVNKKRNRRKSEKVERDRERERGREGEKKKMEREAIRAKNWGKVSTGAGQKVVTPSGGVEWLDWVRYVSV